MASGGVVDSGRLFVELKLFRPAACPKVAGDPRGKTIR